MAYKRVLLKISGEQLSGRFDVGIDPEKATWLAGQIKPVIESGTQLVLVVGGGNMVRGASFAGHGIKRVTADQMGMLSGLINAMAVTDVFESQKISTRCLSNIFADQVAENYNFRRAVKHLVQNRVVIVAGGIARPYFTHDSAAVSLALELECEVVLKATKVDGVYSSDPTKNPDAEHYPTLGYQQAVENPNISVMDKAAMGLAMEQKMPIIIFELDKTGNIAKVVNGDNVGTIIK